MQFNNNDYPLYLIKRSCAVAVRSRRRWCCCCAITGFYAQLDFFLFSPTTISNPITIIYRMIPVTFYSHPRGGSGRLARVATRRGTARRGDEIRVAVAYKLEQSRQQWMDHTGTGCGGGKLIVGSGDDGSVQINAPFAPNYWGVLGPGVVRKRSSSFRASQWIE